MTNNKRKFFIEIITSIILIIIGIIFITPFIWLILTSFDKIGMPFLKIPDFTFNNYITILSNSANQISIMNGLYLALGSASLTTLLSLLAAYPLSRYPISYKFKVLYFLLFLTGLPGIALIIPIYQMFIALNVQNSLTPIVFYLGAMGIPYSVWLMKNFLDNVDIELEEAAWVDGASQLMSIRKILIPLTFPGITTVFIFNFSGVWGNFFVPYILLQSPDKFPIALSIYQFFGQYGDIQYGPLAAFSFIYMLPTLILYIIAQKVMSQGFSLSGGTKN
ncbi:MAG: carbohydrate ABC transporter permease [Brevinema sp.]